MQREPAANHPSAGVTLLGGGALGPRDLDEALAQAPRLVAADGGALAALARGLLPEAVVGDMDSLPPDARARLPADRLHAITEQETTDFDKVLRHVRAPFALAVGFLGGRLDHQLANLNVLLRHAARPCLMLGAEDAVLAAPPRLALDLPPGTRLSLFPLAPVTGRSEGLHWPIDGLNLTPAGRIGTSNRVVGPVRLRFDSPGMIVMIPRPHWHEALRALRQAQHWTDDVRAG